MPMRISHQSKTNNEEEKRNGVSLTMIFKCRLCAYEKNESLLNYVLQSQNQVMCYGSSQIYTPYENRIHIILKNLRAIVPCETHVQNSLLSHKYIEYI